MFSNAPPSISMPIDSKIRRGGATGERQPAPKMPQSQQKKTPGTCD
jgi:hypothetical protein